MSRNDELHPKKYFTFGGAFYVEIHTKEVKEKSLAF